MTHERRNVKRLYPTKAMQLIFNCSGKVVGRIHNISVGGVSIEYDATCQPKLGHEIKVNIAIDLQSPIKVEGMCCVPVYDISTLAHDQTFRGVNMRLCGMKYVDPSQRQQNKLNRLLAAVRY